MKVTITIEDGDGGDRGTGAATRAYIKRPVHQGPVAGDPARGRHRDARLDIATLEKPPPATEEKRRVR